MTLKPSIHAHRCVYTYMCAYMYTHMPINHTVLHEHDLFQLNPPLLTIILMSASGTVQDGSYCLHPHAHISIHTYRHVVFGHHSSSQYLMASSLHHLHVWDLLSCTRRSTTQPRVHYNMYYIHVGHTIFYTWLPVVISS